MHERHHCGASAHSARRSAERGVTAAGQREVIDVEARRSAERGVSAAGQREVIDVNHRAAEQVRQQAELDHRRHRQVQPAALSPRPG